MMCGHAKEMMATSWAGELDSASAARLDQHLGVCGECAAEMAQLSALWEKMGDIPAPEPSLALNARWESTLESLISARRQPQWRFSLAALWPQRPVWQVSIAAACLAIGLSAGYFGRGGLASGHTEMAQLREDLASTKQMVALSLLQQQSATERLRGVDYTVGMRAIEPSVAAALIQAVKSDDSVNVRLAAIDALMKVSTDPGVRQSMVGSLARESSPMVQAALIDYVVEARDHQALGPLKEFSARPDLDPLVRRRVDKAVQQLNEYK